MGAAVSGTNGLHRDGTLDSLCWCTSQVVRVSIFEVRNCLTRSCGSPDCERLGAEYLAERAA